MTTTERTAPPAAPSDHVAGPAPAPDLPAAPAPASAGAPSRLATHLIDGRGPDARGDREVRRRCPVTGEEALVLVPATAAEVADAVAAAHAARRSWRGTPPAERAAALRVAAAAVREAAEYLGALLTGSTGRLRAQSVESAVVAADLLDEAAVTGLGAAGRALAGPSAALDLVRREPHGVVAVITPWNDPFPTAAGLLAAALVTGNTVVHKPSERSAVPGWEMARLIADALPAGVLNVVNGDGETGAAVVADERVALVAHVGSTATGRAIAAAVGARGGRVLLENGGKDPIVVDSGVDPRWAAEQVALGAFANTGQICTSVERVYLHEDVADAVLGELAAIAGRMAVGDPDDPATALGPLVDGLQRDVVAGQVDEAVAAGARCLAGGAVPEGPGSFYPPTVLDGCTADMAIMREETFGPVAAAARVPDIAAALAAANEGRYGLAATVLTNDLGHALRAADELEVGTVKVNGVRRGAGRLRGPAPGQRRRARVRPRPARGHDGAQDRARGGRALSCSRAPGPAPERIAKPQVGTGSSITRGCSEPMQELFSIAGDRRPARNTGGPAMAASNTAGTGRAYVPARARTTGLMVTTVGVVVFNISPFLNWVNPRDGADPRTGYETDSLVPFVAYLGLGLLVALFYAAKRARRGQHRGLTLTSMAVGIAAALQCLAFAINPMGGLERGDDLSSDIGVWVGLIGAAVWAVGSYMFAKEIEGDDDEVAADDVRAGTRHS
ncbi:aldehyde dehydrogenase family protein [Georgenia sp. AZ-5]|uniref:aldehyde dehydrogenase family protein n=1 Tax=Georgenia sp. AZ-5 TaxID=3367526 RepID=UPI0037546ED3